MRCINTVKSCFSNRWITSTLNCKATGKNGKKKTRNAENGMQPSVMALTDKTPHRGEIWLVDLNPGIGHEQKGKRPALIISDNAFNETRAGMVIVLPITSKDKGISLHLPLTPEKTGLDVNSYVKTEDIRAISKERLYKQIGKVDSPIINKIGGILKMLLGF